jgi:hypothetical protein
MRPARLLRWYPRVWRERYGEELLVLIQDTLDEGRPTWRLRLGVIWGGLRERVHQAVRAGTAAAKNTSSGWLATVVAGMILGGLPWTLKAPLPPARAWQKTAAFDALAGAFAVTGVVVLASGLVAAPAFIAFLREGGWQKIRRRVAWAAGASVAAGGGLAGLFLGARSMSSAQVNHSWAYGIGVVATTVALAVASGLWASAVTATAKHLKLATRARAAQPMLAAVTLTAAFALVPANLIWLAATESSLPWLVVGVTNLAVVGFVTPRTMGRAVRQSRRLRTAARGKMTVNRSAQRTYGRHRF